jgi:hypothetical protein
MQVRSPAVLSRCFSLSQAFLTDLCSFSSHPNRPSLRGTQRPATLQTAPSVYSTLRPTSPDSSLRPSQATSPTDGVVGSFRPVPSLFLFVLTRRLLQLVHPLVCILCARRYDPRDGCWNGFRFSRRAFLLFFRFLRLLIFPSIVRPLHRLAHRLR